MFTITYTHKHSKAYIRVSTLNSSLNAYKSKRNYHLNAYKCV